MNQPIQSSSLNPLVYQTLTHQASILPALNCPRASLIAQMVKNSPATQETPVRSGKITGEGIGYPVQCSWASLVAQLVKNPPAMWETWVQSLAWKIPWRRERLPTPVFWPGEFHGLYRTQLSDFHFHFPAYRWQIVGLTFIITQTNLSK